MDFKKKYIKYKLKYLNAKKILDAGSDKINDLSDNNNSEKECLFIGQGQRGFCWLATSILVLYKLQEKGVELKKELKDFVFDTLNKFKTPEKFDNSCPIIPKSLGLTEIFKEEKTFTDELEYLKGSLLDINFDDPNIFKKLHPDNKFVNKEELQKTERVPPEIKELYFEKEFNKLTIDEKAKLNLIFSNNLSSDKNLKVKIIKDEGSITDPSKLDLLELISKMNYDSDDEGDIIINQTDIQKITLKSLVDKLDASFDYYDINADYLIILTKGINKDEFAVINFKLTKKYDNDGFSDSKFINTVLEKSGISLDNNILFQIKSSEDLDKKVKKISNVKDFNIEIFNSFRKFMNKLESTVQKYDMDSILIFNILDQESMGKKVFSYTIHLTGDFIKNNIMRNKMNLLLELENIMKKDNAVGTIRFKNSSDVHAMAFYYCEEKDKVVYCEPNSDKSLDLMSFVGSSSLMNDQWIIPFIDVYFLIDKDTIDLLLIEN